MDLDFLKDLDPETINKRVEEAVKGVNSIGDKALSKECLDMLTQTREGKLNPEELRIIGKKLIDKYAG